MTDSGSATDPHTSCSVLASAGTGKTWQLVARLTRLLLHGAALDSILAITFTRKAAGEMQERLNQRLRELLEADDNRLDTLLAEIGETPTPALCRHARGLYESTLRSDKILRATTFHSFCQDLLQRFPLEAGLPPGFELVEQTGILITESWDAVFADAARYPRGKLAVSLQHLFTALNGLYNTRTALFNFIEHRSDWWAYTQGSKDAAEEAADRLEQRLEIDTETAAGHGLWSDSGRARLQAFHDLLVKHGTATNRKLADALAAALADVAEPLTGIDAIKRVFLTANNEPRKRKASNTQRKAMGESGEERFLELHHAICAQLAAFYEQRNRQTTLATNRAWYYAGSCMLTHYQRIKRERRLLDFADLEWYAFELLNHPDQAHWIQYKLDQRIDHLLIDEFQDTNPTQWRLISPLLEEMAAGGDRARSLFIVGDAKQSIYRFRRGNPRLLTFAADWMQQHLGAARVQLDSSWRSSPLIMETVNTVFQDAGMHGLLSEFQPHSTHLDKQWGRLEIWPLIAAEEAQEPDTDFSQLRNPLLQPRPQRSDRRHYREGQAIASRITEMLDTGFVQADDILILLRSRTHLADYEAALREARIPYLSLDRGTLLESLEIRDLEALLKVLMTPHDNLSLTQVLRSPIFSVDNDDLVQLAAGQSGSWYERLQAVADILEASHPLSRAARLLSAWHVQAGRIPIHDLLETVFQQSNLVQRYTAAFPDTQVPRVRANLTRFVELALEVDAGRYPTLPRFLDKLQQLRSLDKEGPSQATPQSDDNRRVRILTIHASKGLEAPVVILADSASSGGGSKACQTLVRWAAEDDRPGDFLLLNRQLERDAFSRERFEMEQQEEQREAANLLYVAMTRARNMLVISGCQPSRGAADSSWYQQVAVAVHGAAPEDAPLVKTFLEPPQGKPETPPPAADVEVDPRLSQPIRVPPLSLEIAPSRSTAAEEVEAGDVDGVLRGLVIHRLLQLLIDRPDSSAQAPALLSQVANEQGISADDPRLHDWWQEVCRVLENRELAWLLHPDTDWRTYNEVPVAYRDGPRTVYGIIDRLIVAGGQAHLVDYKSHRISSEEQVEQLAAQYRTQLHLYREGVQRLWPGLDVRTYLLLTDGGRLVEVS